MEIFITGGNGFIGSYLAQQLLSAGHNITILTRKSIPEKISPNIKYIKGDLTKSIDPEILNNIDLVFHCAGEITDESKMQALHVDGTKNLLDCFANAIRKSTNKKRWIQLSSTGAYGPPHHPLEDRTITEASEERPVGIYERTKTISDHLVIEKISHIDAEYCILRPSIVIGPNMPNNSFKSLLKMIKKNIFFYIGKPGAISTYIHVEDVVSALILCGTHPNAKNQVFNLSNDSEQEILIEKIKQIYNLKNKTIRVPYVIAKALVSIFSFIPNFPLTENRLYALVNKTKYPINKISTQLGFKLKKEISEILDYQV